MRQNRATNTKTIPFKPMKEVINLLKMHEMRDIYHENTAPVPELWLHGDPLGLSAKVFC